MTTEDAKSYLALREIPQLFESLMTGLMYYRPDNHVAYLQECLQKVQEQGVESVRWNLFIDQRRKTPLPPISGSNSRSQTPNLGMGKREPSFVTEGRHGMMDDSKTRPLPPISSEADSAQVPQCPIVLVMGGPGSGKATQCERLVQRYNGWVHLSMGDLLRKELFSKGSADDRWDMVGTLIKKGEMAPEDMTVDLLRKTLKANHNAAGIIIEGYPRTMEQVQELKQSIGRVDLAFVLDCEESYLEQRLLLRGQENERIDDNNVAVANRIKFFKENTLEVIKHFDDENKVVIIDGDRDAEEIFYDLAMLFDGTFYPHHDAGTTGAAPVGLPRPPSGPKPRSPRPGSTRYSRSGSRAGSRPGSGFAKVASTIVVENPDNGRKDDMPKGPLVCILGGPGTARSDQAKRLLQKYKGCVLVSVGELLKTHMASAISDGSMAPDQATMDLILKVLRDHPSATGTIIEGFPRNQAQVELLNTHVGGVTAVALLDCEETYMQDQLKSLGVSSDLITGKISYFKYNTLPVIAYYDDNNKLAVINGEESSKERMFEETNKTLGEIIMKDSSYPKAAAPPTDSTGGYSDDSAGGYSDEKTGGYDDSAGGYSDEKTGGYGDAAGENVETGGDYGTTAGYEEKTAGGYSSEAIAEDQPKVHHAAPIIVEISDRGRLENQPQCPIVAFFGAPGSGVESYSQRVVEKRPGFVIAKSIQEISDAKDKDVNGIILQGFPGNKDEIEAFYRQVGGLDAVLVFDCEESYSKEKGGSQDEIDAYKSQTLPALAHFDDTSKLTMVDITADELTVGTTIKEVIEFVVKNQRLSSSETSAAAGYSSGQASDSSSAVTIERPAEKTGVAKCFSQVPLVNPDNADTGRKEGLPSVPILSLVGYGTGGRCTELAEKMPGVVHIKGSNVSEVKDAMSAATDAKGFVLEGFPSSQEHLEEFNSTIGGLNGVILYDVSETFLKSSKGATDENLEKYIKASFGVFAHFENVGKLELIDGEESDENVREATDNAVAKLLTLSKDSSS